jgi:DNA polymerase
MNANIAATWREMDTFIHLMSFMPEGKSSLRKSVKFYKHHLQLPNGMPIWYPDLDSSEEGGAWSFGHGKYKSFLYGARLQENIVQGLARVIISEQVLEIEKAGIRTVGSTHDEVLGVVDEKDAPKALAKMLTIMQTSPIWAPDLPLDAEGGFAVEYSK